MDDQPHQPGNETDTFTFAHLHDRFCPANGGHGSAIVVDEWLFRFCSCNICENPFCYILRLLNRHGSQAGHPHPFTICAICEITDDKDFVLPLNIHLVGDTHSTRTISFNAAGLRQFASQRAAMDTCSPQNGLSSYDLLAICRGQVHLLFRDMGNPCLRVNFNSQFTNLVRRTRTKLGWIMSQNMFRRLHDYNSSILRVNMPKVISNGVSCNF